SVGQLDNAPHVRGHPWYIRIILPLTKLPLLQPRNTILPVPERKNEVLAAGSRSLARRRTRCCGLRRAEFRLHVHSLLGPYAAVPTASVDPASPLPPAPDASDRSPPASRMSPMRPSPRMAPPATPRTLPNASPSDLITTSYLPSSSSTTSASGRSASSMMTT